MSTIFIGFEIRKGKFLNEKTGEMIPYSNRMLRAITNDGADSSNFGFAAFEEKVKSSDLSKWLNVSEESVDNTLKNLINKEVEFKRAPKNGEFVVMGFSPAK